ncbi:MAG: GntR family transcriptional regulator [Gammaproteobacteria bacterium]|nr:GntR family transcriptional regulator [Gammaproteobacteria bacterium]
MAQNNQQSIQLGQYNRLKVLSANEYGLDLGFSADESVLLPNRYVEKSMLIDDWVEVFVYLDSEDRLTATTEDPFAKVGQFAFLQCVEVNRVGAFFDWGLPKDLLVPFGQQYKELQPGRFYLLYLYIDNASQRIVATTKLDRHLDKQTARFSKGEEVKAIVRRKTDLGYLCIINNSHSALIFKDQTVKHLKVGTELTAYIHQVRDDGKISLSLHKGAIQAKNALAEQLIEALENNNGFLPLNDKSKPEDIYHYFKVSKAIFKRTLGQLYKERKITIANDGIRLAN